MMNKKWFKKQKFSIFMVYFRALNKNEERVCLQKNVKHIQNWFSNYFKVSSLQSFKLILEMSSIIEGFNY
jgi:hypothetical protein